MGDKNTDIITSRLINLSYREKLDLVKSVWYKTKSESLKIGIKISQNLNREDEIVIIRDCMDLMSKMLEIETRASILYKQNTTNKKVAKILMSCLDVIDQLINLWGTLYREEYSLNGAANKDTAKKLIMSIKVKDEIISLITNNKTTS
ncbi:MAG: hypothetical protein N2169_07680 [bacterium]|nr:hypothetical protein [bacterium]